MATPNIVGCLCLSLLACSGSNTTPQTSTKPKAASPTREAPRPMVDRERDIKVIHLAIDVAKRSGVARFELEPVATASGLTLEIGNLSIKGARDEHGALKFSARSDRLDIGVPPGVTSVIVDYRFGTEVQFNGALPSGSTFTWPTYCGNLFPCRSAPKHGSKYTLSLTGIEKGKTAVYPRRIETRAPAYMIGWAIGEYSYRRLGESASGTEVGVYTSESLSQEVSWGTTNLVEAVSWLEKTLGPYAFGDKLGLVTVDWGDAGYESMEHHPFWHVTRTAAQNQRDNIHQAAHGWFGNGVRIECWEDFLLSEGTTSYLTARAIEATQGVAAANSVWTDYESRLDQKVAWPDGCGDHDILKEGITTTAPYYKGALFFKALEGRIGRDKLDAAMASFYKAHVGSARRFADLLAHVESETGYDARTCADEWLREPYAPAEKVCP